jgi:hypothetical protein
LNAHFIQYSVMAGLDPAIHVFLIRAEGVDARDEPGHDDGLDCS